MKTAEDVLRFWYVEHGRPDWFGGGDAFDAEIERLFSDTHAALARGEGWTWRSDARGRLAEIIVLDQFSRQLFRGQARAFAQDGMALVLAQELVALALDKDMSVPERMFAYMPYMHSESLVVHDESVRLHNELGVAEGIEYERKHRDCIARFGRFPKRNVALGRASTPEELAYIAETGDRGF